MAKRKKSAPDYRLTVRLTKAERAGIREQARRAKTTEGGWVRLMLKSGRRVRQVGKPTRPGRKPTPTGSAHPPASIAKLDNPG